jgi:hypothetical protein
MAESSPALHIPNDTITDLIAGWEREYVRALNAVLAASDGSSADANRWRGHAEAYRQVCERARRAAGLDPVEMTSAEWRTAHGVYTDTEVAAFRARADALTGGSE